MEIIFHFLSILNDKKVGAKIISKTLVLLWALSVALLEFITIWKLEEKGYKMARSVVCHGVSVILMCALHMFDFYI